MSPVFRHGGLRLYLLKLLDEAPRHGYDVIRLLQDKFLGVYSPSPGTIYPRLARLEEEGLVTHEVVDGKKVYKITEAGREEVSRRLDELADLEDDLTASVRDIASQITRDVRETVRSLRDELTSAVREAGRNGRADRDDDHEDARGAAPGSRDEESAPSSAAWSHAAGEEPAGSPAAGAGTAGAGGNAGATSDTGEGRPWPGDWRAWMDWTERGDWREWAGWATQHDWAAWVGWQGWEGCEGRSRPGHREWQDWQKRTRAQPPGHAPGQPRDQREDDSDLATDLERLAAAFASQIRAAARHAEAISEDAVGTLGKILADTLKRAMTEVFHAPRPDSADHGATDQEPGTDHGRSR